ncbi:flagellar hook assembly protein FlgD [Sulfitobacter sp. CW3]|jgi:flagellar basal-body rod modification protein FlgD|uniref:flagellar hook assembly protein FlgD n=1 Tax=unclassified Sulfitobacter TaxID=196795 RepID=UPI001C5D5A13|nr:flagellar hook capping FlgD N-terminal domain-containing protein [Sulfitobacter sp. CW3]MBW4961663.1 flagellar hook assembly protein FlgD [Sulfitobacter sp. CW3]|tara:strand:+ start:20409 stop:21077 length:669 start_codon:yes stop_codon:yes gene_type:complete
MIDATTTSNLAATSSTSASKTATTELEESYNSFLTLLTAQISNQDPLEPVDSTQFVSQLAQLTQVEQSIATNANLESIGSMLSAVAAMSDLQLIGRDVLVPSDQVRMTETEFPLSYQVAAGASEVKIKIYSDGNLVRELNGPSTTEGELIDVAWDRLDAVGLPVPPDTFQVEITASDENGDPVGVTSLTKAEVERVDFTVRGPELQLSNGETVLSQVVQSVL